MAIRTNQSFHDLVITEAIKALNQVDYDVYTNPNQQKNAGINDNYPDIVITEKGDNTVKFIIEVETEDSINLNEAETQWKKYANEIKATFYLLVPESLAFKAKELCQKVGVNVRFATYSREANDMITFNFK